MKNTKKIVLAIICIILVIGGGTILVKGTSFAKGKELNGEYIINPLEIQEKVYDIKEYNQEIYLMTEYGIAKWINGTAEYLVEQPITQYNTFAVGEDHIIFTDNDARKWFRVNRYTNGVEENNWSDLDDFSITRIEKMLIEEDNLWILANTENYNKDLILKKDLKTNELEKVLEDKIYTMEYISEKEILLVTSNEEGFEIVKYNIETNQEEIWVTTESDIWGMVYDPRNKQVYFWGYEGLFRATEDEKNYSIIVDNVYGEADKTVYGIALEEGLVLTEEGLGELEKDNTKKLEIIVLEDEAYGGNNLAPHLKDAVKEMRKTNPSLYVEQVGLKNYNDNIRKKLLAQDSDFDIFSMDINILSTMEGEFFEPLDDYNEIQEKYDIMFEGIEAINKNQQQQIISIPEFITMPTWGVNSESLGTLEFDANKSKTWTWNDFLSESRKHCKDLDGDNKPDVWLTSWTAEDIIDYIFQVNKVTCDLDKQVLQQLIESIKLAQEEGILISSERRETISNEQIILLDNTFNGYRNEGSESVELLLPSINADNPMYIAMGRVYCINPYSKNIETAVDILAKSCEPSNYLISTSGFLYKDKEVYNQYRSYEYSEPLNLDDENFDRYAYGLNHIAIANQCIHNTGLSDMVKAYLNGEVSIEELSEKMLE